MKSPFYFIVTPKDGARYDNTKDVGGIKLITSVSQENHLASNRFAVVVQTPLWYDGEIEPGDILVVHHNVFKFYYNMKGRQKSGWSFVKDKTFLISVDQFYMYKHGGVWKTVRDCCFVSPIEAQDGVVARTIAHEPLVGVIRYGNSQLDDLGVHEGDVVGFDPESEYEFDIDGEKLYRMYTRNITIKFNGDEFLENTAGAV